MKKGLKVFFLGLALLVSCGLFLACPNQTVTPEPTPTPASAFPVTITISKAADATKDGYGTIDVTGEATSDGTNVTITSITGTTVSDTAPSAASDKQVVVQIGDKKYRVQGTATVNNNSTSMALDVEGGFVALADGDTAIANNASGDRVCSTENVPNHAGAIAAVADADKNTVAFSDSAYTITFTEAATKTYNIYKKIDSSEKDFSNGVWHPSYKLTLVADVEGKVTPTFALPSAQAGE